MCRIFRDSFLSRYGSLVFLLGSHRQCSAGWFVECLDRIRVGTVTDTDLVVLNSTSSGVSDEEWGSRTQLRARNSDVDKFNLSKLRSLAGPEVVYRCEDEINPSLKHAGRRQYATKRLQATAAPALTIKPGAVVMLTRELAGIPTATQGSVMRCGAAEVVCVFSGTEVTVPLVSFDVFDNTGMRLATRRAMPLVLAWAMTIHRAQGSNLDSLAINFRNLHWREPGLVYSGLSRCRLFKNLFVRDLRRENIVVCADAMHFYGL